MSFFKSFIFQKCVILFVIFNLRREYNAIRKRSL